jgi:hypothetical protein
MGRLGSRLMRPKGYDAAADTVAFELPGGAGLKWSASPDRKSMRTGFRAAASVYAHAKQEEMLPGRPLRRQCPVSTSERYVTCSWEICIRIRVEIQVAHACTRSSRGASNFIDAEMLFPLVQPNKTLDILSICAYDQAFPLSRDGLERADKGYTVVTGGRRQCVARARANQQRIVSRTRQASSKAP